VAASLYDVSGHIYGEGKRGGKDLEGEEVGETHLGTVCWFNDAQ